MYHVLERVIWQFAILRNERGFLLLAFKTTDKVGQTWELLQEKLR